MNVSPSSSATISRDRAPVGRVRQEQDTANEKRATVERRRDEATAKRAQQETAERVAARSPEAGARKVGSQLDRSA